jgi:hypothetical protein
MIPLAKRFFVFMALIGIAGAAYPWNPLKPKQCLKQTPLSNSEDARIKWKLVIQGINLYGAAFHDLPGDITCHSVAIRNSRGVKNYFVNILLAPNMRNDIPPVRLFESGTDATFECGCRRVNGEGACVGYMNLDECK